MRSARKIMVAGAVLLVLLTLTAASSSNRPEPNAYRAATIPPNERDAEIATLDIRQAIPQADVIIDAGHGGIDGGTHWGAIKESDINLAIGRKLYLLLRSQDVRAILNRTGDYALSDDNRWHKTRSRHQRDLTQRRSLPDEVKASTLVSIHVNWAPRGGRGPLVIYRKGDGRSRLLALHIQNSLNRQQGIKLRTPQSSDRFYILNQAKIPSVIVETAYLSDPQDRAMLTSLLGQTRVAEAIASGIIAYRALTPEPSS